MKQNSSFTLKEIAGVPYLLPYGQMIADHKRGLKTNATGAYLWDLLQEEHSLEEILANSAAYYEITAKDLPSFQKELTQFLSQLLALGILVDSNQKSPVSANTLHVIQASRNAASTAKSKTTVPVSSEVSPCTEHVLSIGGLNIKLITPADAVPPDFSAFLLSPSRAGNVAIHQTIFLHPTLPEQGISGKALLQNLELNIVEQETQYLLHFPTAKTHLEIQLSKDGMTAHCYCLPPFTKDFHYDFFHAIRLLYLYLAQRSGMAALHSASILYQDKLWLFSGHSGMGKSTHTNLWKEHFNTPVINGDLNLLAIENGKPVVHGIPWCGTSGIYDTKTYPLGGIILLNKAPKNKLEELTPDQKQLLVSQRLISPSWTRKLWEKNLELVKELTEHILVCRLHCTKETDAAVLMKERIDDFLL